ncbi:Dehydrogenase RED2 [Colletotrichum gloeosporioides]|uniref:Short-chain dehydrogenase/reductase 3 n=1 Tax=Colletotrichum gloeosporioides TaxID=474922 RepID=A0A8H4FPN7_COLGL|nr:Dehydrogenase RED2 [Colletotrichum gloeosporioides]KAF3809973.1 Dehydrogenase RED2 [Colletotrichum gloeosporioides]
MTDIISSTLKTINGIAAVAVHPLVPASLLTFVAYSPPDMLRRFPSLNRLHQLLTANFVVRYRLPLQILLVAGIARYLNRAANRWALNNWRLTSHPGWRWANEIAVVTGGCNGIGKAIVIGLAQKGVTVAVLDIQPMPADLRANQKVKYWKCDITSPEAVSASATEIRASLGNPSIVVNNAGVAYTHSVIETDPEDLRRIFGVNLLSLWSTAKEFIPDMIMKNKGHIVTVASMASYSALPTAVDYSATKAGALAFSEGLSCEIKHVYKASGILTTVVHPMWVKTNMTAAHAERVEQSYGRMMEPEDVAKRVTGQIFSCRGGQLIIPDQWSWASGNRGLPSWVQEIMRDAVGREVPRLGEAK